MSAVPRRVLVRALACALALACATAAHAEVAPGDSLLHEYVRGLADSTDAWFGATAAPTDTAGLDSALVAGLAKKPVRRGGMLVSAARRPRLGIDWSPALGFNRADGGQLGGGAALRGPLPGRFSGRAQYTTGNENWLGEFGWNGSWRLPGTRTRAALRAAAGRWTEPFDRDHFDPFFASLLAVTFGADRHQYLRRDGVSLRAGLTTREERQSASVGWRDQLESPLSYTTRWTMFGGTPDPTVNRTAAFGRARELSLAGSAFVPGTRFRAEARYWTSDPRMGSDFRYRRLTLGAGGDVSLGRHLALVPQAGYARLRGEVLPQDVLFLGGVHDLRTLERNELEGTGRAFARADLVFVDELGHALHLPLPAIMPLQFSTFVASGAVWGRDAVSRTAVSTRRDWPRRAEWLSEAGVSLLWRLGLPEPEAGLRLEYAVPIGADAREAKLVFAYQGILPLLRAH